MESKRATILVVEDDVAILRMVQHLLRDVGFEVLTADSGPKALAVESKWEQPLDLLIADVVMPGMTGPELATTMKDRRPELRVILISGYPDGALLVLNPAWRFVGKPFLPRMLVNHVEAILADQAPGRLPGVHGSD